MKSNSSGSHVRTNRPKNTIFRLLLNITINAITHPRLCVNCQDHHSQLKRTGQIPSPDKKAQRWPKDLWKIHLGLMLGIWVSWLKCQILWFNTNSTMRHSPFLRPLFRSSLQGKWHNYETCFKVVNWGHPLEIKCITSSRLPVCNYRPVVSQCHFEN